MKQYLLILILLSIGMGGVSEAQQHPIEIQHLTADGHYFKALTSFQKLPRRQIRPETLKAAGRSAWALGLSEKASEYIDRVLRDEDLTVNERAQLQFQKAMIEYQEENLRVASLFADRAIEQLIEPSRLRGMIYTLKGDVAKDLGVLSDARRYYEKALDEVSSELIPDVSFRAGEVARSMGDRKAAIDLYRAVPLEHPRTPQAIRALAEIALEQDQPTQVSFWLERGRELYPDAFLDSWVYYALIRAAEANSEDEKVRQLREEASKKYPPSDTWLSLLQASAEIHEWKEETHKP